MIKAFIPGRDLEERTGRFAKDIRTFILKLPKTLSNVEDTKQLARSSGSIGANYIEANESLGKQDFLMRARIARKECKETLYWLNLLHTGLDQNTTTEHRRLIDEARQLMLILSAIIMKCGGKR